MKNSALKWPKQNKECSAPLLLQVTTGTVKEEINIEKSKRKGHILKV